MFKGHPKGLYALALANTGERFGYYTMLAIFVLFLQTKFGLTVNPNSIYGIFLGLVYVLPFLGGILADIYGYSKMITIGFVVMLGGYALLSVPTEANSFGLTLMYGALLLISCGTGLFKGNLQVMVGNLYDSPQYKSKRDTAFSIFYMAINIGALFAPTAATKMTNYVLGKSDFFYNPQLPSLAHQFIDGKITEEGGKLLASAQEAQGFVGDTMTFCHNYLFELSKAYNYGFAIACGSLILSMIIYYSFKSTFKHADYTKKEIAKEEQAEELTPKQTKDRIVALLLVFFVVIFFWMAFHQNGLTFTYFARDYTQHSVTGLTRIGFDIWNIVLLIIAVYSGFSIFQSKTSKARIISIVVFLAAIGITIANYMNLDSSISILPQIFQQFNPFFVVALTPFSLAIFGSLARKGKEPSAPRKIGTGMFIAACGFALLAFGSFGLPTPNEVAANGITEGQLVSPNWLISTYLVLTFAELLLSPMGISFVSKVAPPKLKGTMMGAWFLATGIGNTMTSIIGNLWGGMELWMVWSVLIVCCLLSALFIFSILKRLEKTTNGL